MKIIYLINKINFKKPYFNREKSIKGCKNQREEMYDIVVILEKYPLLSVGGIYFSRIHNSLKLFPPPKFDV